MDKAFHGAKKPLVAETGTNTKHAAAPENEVESDGALVETVMYQLVVVAARGRERGEHRVATTRVEPDACGEHHSFDIVVAPCGIYESVDVRRAMDACILQTFELPWQ